MEISRSRQLPAEILEKIFCQVDVSDIPAIASTCKRFNRILESSRKVWRELFRKRCPRLLQPACAAELSLLLSECSRNWRTLTRCRLDASMHLQSILDQMANRHYTTAGLPDLAMQDFRQVACAHGPLVMRDALLDEIFHPVPHRKFGLSRSYYSTMLYREIQRDEVLLPIMRVFMKLPPEEQTFRKAYWALSMWQFPELGLRTPPNIDRYADRVADLVLAELKSSHPDHPAANWTGTRSEPLQASLWSDVKTQQVISCVNWVLYDRLRLVTDRRTVEPENDVDEEPEEPENDVDEEPEEPENDENEEPEESEDDENEEPEESEDDGSEASEELEDKGSENSEEAELRNTLESVYRDVLVWGSDLEGVITVLYSEVAGRLGVLVELLCMTDSRMVRWQPREYEDPVFIDVMAGGALLPLDVALEEAQKTSPEAYHRLLLQSRTPGMVLNYLTSSRYQRKRACPRTEADVLADRLLLFRTMTGCNPTRDQLAPACTLYQTERPAYTRRLCQEIVNAYKDDGGTDVAEVKLFMDLLTERHDAMHLFSEEQEMTLLHYVPSVCPVSCYHYVPRLYVGDVVHFRGDEDGPMAVIFGIMTTAISDSRGTAYYDLLIDGEKMATDQLEDKLVLAQRPRPVRHLEVGRYFTEYHCGRYQPLPYLQLLYSAPNLQHPTPAADSGTVYTGRAADQEQPPTTWFGNWPHLLLP